MRERECVCVCVTVERINDRVRGEIDCEDLERENVCVCREI